MTEESSLLRQEHIQNLGQFSRALAEALEKSALGPDTLRQALCVALSAECVQCAIRVTGEELLALSAPALGSATNPRVARLRQGYCARNHCDSYYYRLMFAVHPDIDWPRLLAQIESTGGEGGGAAPGDATPKIATQNPARARRFSRVAIGVAILAMLWILRQWYRGGTIPWVREPENFQVDRGVSQ